MSKSTKNDGYSKMMYKYLEKKEQYPDTIMFYRLGDFYEMFFEDAIRASKILDITLTSRDCGSGQKAPMCGVPYHAAETYITKLTDCGLKVAICEQLSEPQKGQIVERDVVRIVTPGTVMEEEKLLHKQNNFIASVSSERASVIGLSWIDLSTGEFYAQQFTGDDAFTKLSDTLSSIAPSEVIADKNSCLQSTNLQCMKMGSVPNFSSFRDSAFEYDEAKKALLRQLKAKSVEEIGCDKKGQALCSAGALITYLLETQMRDLDHINELKVINDGHYMYLDINAKYNLELTKTIFEGKTRGTLLWVLDKTETAMGVRLLKNWLEHPLQDEVGINDRLDAVEELSHDTIARAKLRELMRNISDIERHCGRASYGNLNPRNCESLGRALVNLPSIKQLLGKFNSKLLRECAKNIYELKELAEELTTAFVENPPTSIKDGGFIKHGFDPEFDKCLDAKRDGNQWMTALEARERELTGEKKLKISYNRITGYYFEVPKSASENLPFRFQRIQSTANADRFSTADLKKLEETVLYAEEQKLTIELQVFDRIRQDILNKLTEIQVTSRQLAILDCLQSFAEVAVTNNYTRPVINNQVDEYNIVESRHPVVEKMLAENNGGLFVPNDLLLNNDQRTIIITGPNMAGKSTFMRQIALIVLMAHIGCFVPAKSARISITDRIFTRIGASDNLGMGQSTFMVEMSEVSNIVRNATKDSLLILDEIGRGTSTQDGLSIAWAVLEYISTTIKAKTLFATHYHKLTELQGKLPGVVNMRVTVSEFDNQMSFLRKIEYGSTNKSFGVEVAKLAGIPQVIINRAKEVMKDQDIVDGQAFDMAIKQYDYSNVELQAKYEAVSEMLKNTDVNNLTPIEAITKLAELKQKIK